MSQFFALDEIKPHSPLITEFLQEWAIAHCRSRTFFQEETIPTRPGLLYFVTKGFVRLESRLRHFQPSLSLDGQPVILAFIGADQPIDIYRSSMISFQAIAQVDQTEVFWLYWEDLDQWPTLKNNVLQALRHQQQHQRLEQTLLCQRKTIDRLWLYLEMLGRTHGNPSPEGMMIPFPLTSKQLSEVLGATQVTVNRLLKQLMQADKIQLTQADRFQVRLSH
ncbi:Crp/Fnr family transcriptional regulator [Picosynechococcus sp. PCC 7117]|uniref:Crp/Fnr family transcriptional regulator n=1 Tax=Picosynechococcus sp. PCC 7117 TaxID=195498 RepID=UPI000810BAD3|nr:Crp/Fnr family transcriptional regulator [Picosynechococcus sp. PCC 7117]ANV87316.1 hypothetical protein AWQ22_07490 [Picosynechococcus sp. PCC 7117]